MKSIVDAATDYIERGLRVIALEGKMPNRLMHPRGLHDYLDIYANKNAVRRAFGHPATTGVGILTGKPLFVVDIDGEEGAVQYGELTGDRRIPDTWTAKTGRGLHVYFADFEDWPTKKLGPKLDFKSVGGYVAAPPSVHPSGHIYLWLFAPEDGNLAELPLALQKRFAKDREHATQTLVTHVDQRMEEVGPPDGLLRWLAQSPEGERNDALFGVAVRLFDDGHGDEIIPRIESAALKAGLDKDEIRQTIKSAARRSRG